MKKCLIFLTWGLIWLHPPFKVFLNVLFVFVFWRFVIVGKGVYKIFSITEMEKMRHCKKGWKSIFHYTASCDVSFQMEDVPIIYLNHFESLYIWIIWRLLISQGRDRAQRHILSQINGKKNKRFCTSIHLISLLLIPFTENRYITPHFYILVINSKWKIFFLY